MNSENLVYFVAVFVCAIIFISISIYAFFTKKPINFWTWEKISADSITDIKSFNRSYGIMWLIYGLCWLISDVLGLFSFVASIIFLIF